LTCLSGPACSSRAEPTTTFLWQRRQVIRSHHRLSVKHLNSYLGQFEWRCNDRENPFLLRGTLLKLISAGHPAVQGTYA
jgi:hypothetical protein